MARAKRLNAEKVTVSINSDVLLIAKHKALDLKLTLSDYMQGLLIADTKIVDLSHKAETRETIKPELGMDIFENISIEMATEERIREVWKQNEGMKRGRNKLIAEILNGCNQLDNNGRLWTDKSIKNEIDKLSKRDKRLPKSEVPK